MYSVKIFPTKGWSLKEYPTKTLPKKKPHKKGGAQLYCSWSKLEVHTDFHLIPEKKNN